MSDIQPVQAITAKMTEAPHVKNYMGTSLSWSSDAYDHPRFGCYYIESSNTLSFEDIEQYAIIQEYGNEPYQGKHSIWLPSKKKYWRLRIHLDYMTGPRLPWSEIAISGDSD